MLALLMAAAFCAAAEPKTEVAPRALSLDDAVALGLKQNPGLGAVREDLPAAVARLKMAQAEGKLTASATAFLSTGTMPSMLAGPSSVMPAMSVNVPADRNADQSILLMYPLSTGGRVQSRSAAAKARLLGTRADIDAMVLDTAYAVRAAYWRVLLAREMLKVQQENLAQQRERLRVDQAAEEAGKIPVYYVLRDKAEVADAEQGAAKAARDVETALLDLRVAIGIPSATPLELSDKLMYEPMAPTLDVEAAVAAALLKRPETASKQAAIEAARREVRARRAAYRPQVDAMLMMEGIKTSESTMGGYTLGVVAALPILDGGSRAADVAEAEAMLRRAEKESVGQNLEVERQVRAALVTLVTADHCVRTSMEAVASADEDYRVALLRYQAGKAINLEPISALAGLVKAKTNLAEALYDHNLARDAFMRAQGELP
jgi:outer membrane protein TolC